MRFTSAKTYTSFHTFASRNNFASSTRNSALWNWPCESWWKNAKPPSPLRTSFSEESPRVSRPGWVDRSAAAASAEASCGLSRARSRWFSLSVRRLTASDCCRNCSFSARFSSFNCRSSVARSFVSAATRRFVIAQKENISAPNSAWRQNRGSGVLIGGRTQTVANAIGLRQVISHDWAKREKRQLRSRPLYLQTTALALGCADRLDHVHEVHPRTTKVVTPDSVGLVHKSRPPV